MVPANSNKDSPKDSKGKVATSSKNAQAKDHNGRTSEEPEPKKQKVKNSLPTHWPTVASVEADMAL